MKFLVLAAMIMSAFSVHAQTAPEGVPEAAVIKGEIFEGGSDVGNSTDPDDEALMQSLVEGEAFVTVIHSVKGNARLFYVTHPKVGKITVRAASAAVEQDLRKNLGLTRKLIAAWDESGEGLALVAPLVIYRVTSAK